MRHPQDGPKREDGETSGPEAPAPKTIGEPADGEQQAGDDHQVGNHYPLNGPAQGGAKGSRNSGVADIHTRGIQLGHEDADSNNGKDLPFVRLGPQRTAQEARSALFAPTSS